MRLLNNESMTTSSSVSRVVMQRIRIMHALRPFVSGTALASVLFLIAVWGIGREVWVAHVIANMPSASDISAVVRFFVSAFLNTRFIVQALTILAGGAFVFALREMVLARPIGQRFA